MKKDNSDKKIDFAPMIARPFFFNTLRNKYLEVGKINHRSMHFQMLAKLEEAFRAQGDTTTKFYISFLDDNPRPDAAAIQALNEGASRIIVSEVFLTISNYIAEGENRCPHALKRTIVDSTNKKSVIGNHSRGIFAKTIYLPT